MTKMQIELDEAWLLRQVWAALGCASNPDDFKPSVRALMWQQVIEMARASTEQATGIYRENKELIERAERAEAVIAEALAATDSVADQLIWASWEAYDILAAYQNEKTA